MKIRRNESEREEDKEEGEETENMEQGESRLEK